MGYDEEFSPKPRSEQSQISGMGLEGERDVQEARAWIEANPNAYNFMVRNARRLNRKGYVSARYLVHMLRNELHVKVKNGLSPAFARIIEQENPEPKGAFRMHGSRADGFA